MSVELGTETLTVSKSRRSWRINIETPLGGDYALTAHRELVKQAGGTVIAKTPEPDVNRSLSAVIAESVTLASGKTISPAEINEALALYIERWDAEDRA